MLPVLFPKQTLLFTLNVSITNGKAGCVMLIVAVLGHPFKSVTTTE